jgi:predicted nucleotidyltransferase
MEDRSTIPAQTEPLAAYWNASMLPSMPRFLRELIAQATAQLQVSTIRVFGSRARADCQPTSDYDIAFELDDTQGWEEFVTTQPDEAWTLLPLDLVNVQDASEALRQEIETAGVILYAR